MRSSIFWGELCYGGRCGIFVILQLALLLAVATSPIGCGKHRELAPLTGKVLYNGKPLSFGSVVIEHEYGQPASGVIQPDGTFEVTTRGEGEGAVVGTRRIRIACYENQDPAKQSSLNPPTTLGRSLIPTKYTSFETSGLTIEVLPDANEPVVINLR